MQWSQHCFVWSPHGYSTKEIDHAGTYLVLLISLLSVEDPTLLPLEQKNGTIPSSTALCQQTLSDGWLRHQFNLNECNPDLFSWQTGFPQGKYALNGRPYIRSALWQQQWHSCLLLQTRTNMVSWNPREAFNFTSVSSHATGLGATRIVWAKTALWPLLGCWGHVPLQGVLSQAVGFSWVQANEDGNCYSYDMRKLNRATCIHMDHVSAV